MLSYGAGCCSREATSSLISASLRRLCSASGSSHSGATTSRTSRACPLPRTYRRAAAFGMEVFEFVAGIGDDERGFTKEARRALARSFAKEHGATLAIIGVGVTVIGLHGMTHWGGRGRVLHICSPLALV